MKEIATPQAVAELYRFLVIQPEHGNPPAENVGNAPAAELHLFYSSAPFCAVGAGHGVAHRAKALFASLRQIAYGISRAMGGE